MPSAWFPKPSIDAFRRLDAKMRLNKPPIVEAWIGFRFERRPDAAETYPASAIAYLAKHTIDYPQAEYEFQTPVTVQAGGPREPPKPIVHDTVVTRIRSFNVPRTRCLQFSKEQLVFSALKTVDPYPGYDTMRNEAMVVQAEYVEQIEPLYIRSAALYYKDIIEIAAPGGRIENLGRYFNGVSDFSEETFGDAISFNYQNVFKCPVDEGPLIQTLQPIPMELGSEIFKFELTWLKVCSELNTLNDAEIRRRLDAAHDYLRNCFRKIVTDQTWQLFDPQED